MKNVEILRVLQKIRALLRHDQVLEAMDELKELERLIFHQE